MIKVLFVCLGNICRSPMAEFVFKQMVAEKGLSEQFYIDSAATERFNEMCHAGIHYGTCDKLKAMQIPFEEHYSRQIRPRDYVYFDYIIAMDDSNIDKLNDRAPDLETMKKIHRMTDYCITKVVDSVPDPYYGGAQGFENVLDILEDACSGLLENILSEKKNPE